MPLTYSWSLPKGNAVFTAASPAPPAEPGGFSVPDIYFLSGVSSNHDLRQYVPAEFDGLALFIDGTLPAGVTFDNTLDAERLVYDGTSGDTTVSGILLVVIPE